MVTVVKNTSVAYAMSLNADEATLLTALTQNALTNETAEQTATRQGIFTALTTAASVQS